MEKISIYQWIGIAVAVLAVVGCIVLVFKAPLAAITLAVGDIVGMAAMYLLKKHNIVNK